MTGLCRLRALVLAAGKGTRIRSVSGGRPKPLLEIDGRPLIGHNIAWLRACGIRDILINTHFGADEIVAALGSGAGYGVRVSYRHEEALLGTACSYLRYSGDLGEPALVVYGDNLNRFDLRRFFKAHRASGAAASISLFDPRRNANTGIAGGRVVCSRTGRVLKFTEGKTGRLHASRPVNAGVYLLNGAVSRFAANGRWPDFGRDLFPAMLRAGVPIHGHLMERGGMCLGFDTPESYRNGLEVLERCSLVGARERAA